ncbi:Uncharacterized membrane protein YsdA, DUF1294 family [Flavobacterium gillisiae]|uniref:Uncharacterized membrane protein YsdA, DUF1294 family n=1 Tax=Flavobacterium gillisiae TaxID=150146 RepID=A0A1H3Z807_9FLAO|nr:DUF1294 domain-containing protein [Flavobacterium gillisiae]SEA19790.1 Uncharacterized membrane protein YsdA, DUF1294 family [Flavobacterium gillisiae]
MIILFYCFLIINTLGFLVTAYDKYLAKAQKRRIPEKTLLSFVAFGGTVGAGIAMLLFRHKTSKRTYLLKFWVIVVIQIVLLYAYYYFGLKSK